MSSDLENFIATTEHRRPGRILYKAGFTPDLRRRVVEHIGTEDIGGHYGFMRSAGLPLRRPEALAPLDFSRYWENEDLPEGTQFRGGVAQVPSGLYHFFGFVSPLRNATSLREIEEYPIDDMSDWDFSYMKALVDRAHADGKVVIGGVGHIFETAWQIRGLEQFMMDVHERPAWAECLVERLAEQNRIKATVAARAGADMIHCGDDVAHQQAMMFSPEMWRTLLHEPWRRIWREVEDINPDTRIWYHSDGNITNIVDDLIAAGVDVLNPVQPECVDTDALYAMYGKRLTFDGTIGTQTTMPFGSAADVRERVREVIEKHGQDGGLIISPTHVLEPEVPLENIDALVDACREFGTFD